MHLHFSKKLFTIPVVAYSIKPFWEDFSSSYLSQIKVIYKWLLGTEEQPNEPAPLANGSSSDENKNHKVLKDAYEKEVADIREKPNNVWCHLPLTLDAASFMGLWWDITVWETTAAKACKLLPDRLQSVETTTVVSLVAQLARLQLKDSEDFDSFLIRGQELLTKLQEAVEAVSENFFNAIYLQESFNPAMNFTELRERLNFH